MRSRARGAHLESTALGVGDVALVVSAIEVDAIPAPARVKSAELSPEYASPLAATHVGKKRLVRMPPGQGLVGKLRVSEPPPGGALGPPKLASKQRKLDCCWSRVLRFSRRKGLPTSMRKPLTRLCQRHASMGGVQGA